VAFDVTSYGQRLTLAHTWAGLAVGSRSRLSKVLAITGAISSMRFLQSCSMPVSKSHPAYKAD